MKSKGFTLIELMVVVVIIGILAAIAIPNFMSMRQRAQEASVKSNMHTLQVSLENYSTMCQGVYSVDMNTQVDAILVPMGFVNIVDDHAIADVDPDGTGATVNDGNPRAKLSMEMFFYRVRKYIGAYAAVLNGVDIIVFTGGIGENCSHLSGGLCGGLDFLGARLNTDDTVNMRSDARIISTEDSQVTMMVIPTNEELVIAEETLQLLGKKNN